MHFWHPGAQAYISHVQYQIVDVIAAGVQFVSVSSPTMIFQDFGATLLCDYKYFLMIWIVSRLW